MNDSTNKTDRNREGGCTRPTGYARRLWLLDAMCTGLATGQGAAVLAGLLGLSFTPSLLVSLGIGTCFGARCYRAHNISAQRRDENL